VIKFSLGRKYPKKIDSGKAAIEAIVAVIKLRHKA